MNFAFVVFGICIGYRCCNCCFFYLFIGFPVLIEVNSGSAIEHLASEEHWKRVKGFMWKYGGGMDRVDSFRIAEVDYAKVLLKIN